MQRDNRAYFENAPFNSQKAKIMGPGNDFSGSGTILGDIRAGMAAAAFSAATAVQRAQLMLQEKQKLQSEVSNINSTKDFNDCMEPSNCLLYTSDAADE